MIDVVIWWVLIQRVGEREDGAVIITICNCYGVTETKINTFLLGILVTIPP